LEQSVLQAFTDAGVTAVVAEYVPPYAEMEGWHQVQDTNYFIYIFEQ
jgi:hypothetical protein